MKPIRNLIPCSKCGCPDIPKYVRRRNRNGKIRTTIASYCILCKREDSAIINRKRYKLKKYDYKTRNKQWRNRNKEQYNKSQRLWYQKNKDSLCEKARMNYVPSVIYKRKKIVRVYQPNNPWRGFDFKNRERVNNVRNQVESVWFVR